MSASLRRPSTERIHAALAARATHFSYPEVGATAELGWEAQPPLVRRYDVDVHGCSLGAGSERYEQAVEALFAWRHFDVPWVGFHGGTPPAHEGQTVATLVSRAPLWFLNPCRVVYVEPSDGQRAAFAYGTLPGHVERGEERFEITIDPDTEEVQYRIAAFSRPGSVWTRLGYPFTRRVQNRFAIDSGVALAAAAGDYIGVDEVSRDPAGLLVVTPRLPADRDFSFVYRAAMGVAWDETRRCLTTSPREESTREAFERIRAAVSDEYRKTLFLRPTARWSGLSDAEHRACSASATQGPTRLG